MTGNKNGVKSYYILPVRQSAQIWCMSPQERIQKQLKDMDAVKDISALGADDMVLVLRGDGVYDTPVLRGLLVSDQGVFLVDDQARLAAFVRGAGAEDAVAWLERGGNLPAGAHVVTSAQAGQSYNHNLRKREPAASYILEENNSRAVEWKLYKAAYKGVVDFVTKYWWPVPTFHVTRFCARHDISPNMVTYFGMVLMFAALFLFAAGYFWTGLIAGWVMTFLDTVDGKLARVTLTSSKFGNILDHGMDLIHPPFWYIAWGYGLVHYGTPLPEGWLGPVLTVMFVFYVLGRLVEGYFMRRFDMHIHVWRRFDSFFREILARRNPNMVLLTGFLFIGRPDIGLMVITLWTVFTFFVHIVQSVQAEQIRARGEPVVSWLSL